MTALVRVYGSVLRRALDHPWVVGFLCLVLVVGSFYCYQSLGSDLLPEMDEGGFILDYYMPAGAALEETNRVLNGVEEMLRATPEVENTSRRTGMQLGLAAVTEANTGDFALSLRDRPAEAWMRSRRNCATRLLRSTRCLMWSSSNCCRI